MNFAAIAITCVVFHHADSLGEALLHSTNFAFHYLALAIALSVIEPIAEYLVRFQIEVDVVKPTLSINKTALLYLYAFALSLLNFIRTLDNTFWGDEGFSIRLAKMNIPQMIESTATDVHPPLYYLFIQLLYKCFGNSGVVYHFSAFIPYIVILWIACTVVRKRFGVIPAIVLVTMSSIMKNAITYNVEVRMYALAAMLVLVAYIALYDIAKKDDIGSWVAFCIASLGAAYTHYYALVSVAFFYLMLIPLALNKRRIKRAVAAYVITIIGYLPWFMVLLGSFTRTKDNWWLGDIPSVEDCVHFILDYDWTAGFFCIAFVMFLLYEMHIISVEKTGETSWLKRVQLKIKLPERISLTNELLWVVAGLLSICGTAAVGLGLSYALRPFFIVRYLFPVSAMAYLLFGYCISKMKLRKLWATFLVAAILWNNLPAYMETYKVDKTADVQTENFLTAVEPAENAVIYTDSVHLDWTILDCYYPNKHIYTQDVQKCLDNGESEIWLFWGSQLDEDAENKLKSNGYSLQEVYNGFFATSAHVAYKLVRNNL